MAKVVAILTDGNYNVDVSKVRLVVITIVSPEAGDAFEGRRFDTYVDITGTETPQQANTAIETAVKAIVLAQMGLTIQSVNILSNKFS